MSMKSLRKAFEATLFEDLPETIFQSTWSAAMWYEGNAKEGYDSHYIKTDLGLEYCAAFVCNLVKE